MNTKIIIILSLTLATQMATATQPDKLKNIYRILNRLENKYHRKIGLYAFDSNTNKEIAYNANKKFPFQSTFKLVGVAAFLYQDQKLPMLDEKITIKKSDIVPWGPISHQYLNKAVSYKTLCKAAISYSDNTAINLIINKLGGIEKINQFSALLGEKSFNLNHIEINLNSNLNDNADTSTPKAMANMLKKLFNTYHLSSNNKALLKEWLLNNTTGNDRIRAGVPLGWSVADKTGSGQYGVANDLGIAWSSACKPIILSIYTAGSKQALSPNSHLISEVTKLTIQTFSRHHPCYQLGPFYISSRDEGKFIL